MWGEEMADGDWSLLSRGFLEHVVGRDVWAMFFLKLLLLLLLLYEN